MFDVIDDFVIDHGFQPIVNRLLMHPIDIAMTTATGSSVLLITGTIINVNWRNYVVVAFVLLGVFAQVCALLSYRLTFPRVRSLIKPGLRNPFREINKSQRWITLPSATIMIIIVISIMPYLKALLLFFGFVCWVATIFFQVCDYPPIKPKLNPIPIHRDLVAE
jgi:ABC-type multidrug transport system permease subunit